jgi:hypothetical protein
MNRFIAASILPLALLAPAVAAAQPPAVIAQTSTAPSKEDAIKSALKSCNLTMRQKMQIKPMMENYQTQSAGADPATKKNMQTALVKQIYGTLTPSQQTTFKQSMMSSM